MNYPAPLAPRYEALFRVSDSLRVHRDIQELFRVLPIQLQPVLDFDYMSVFLKKESAADACWYVLDDKDQYVLTLAKDVPIEQAHVSWAFEHQQPAFVAQLHQEPRFWSANRLLSGRGLQSGCAVPLTTANRRLGAIFLGSEHSRPRSDEEVRFLAFVADQVAMVVDGVLSRQPTLECCTSDNLYKENLALRVPQTTPLQS